MVHFPASHVWLPEGISIEESEMLDNLKVQTTKIGFVETQLDVIGISWDITNWPWCMVFGRPSHNTKTLTMVDKSRNNGWMIIPKHCVNHPCLHHGTYEFVQNGWKWGIQFIAIFTVFFVWISAGAIGGCVIFRQTKSVDLANKNQGIRQTSWWGYNSDNDHNSPSWNFR